MLTYWKSDKGGSVVVLNSGLNAKQVYNMLGNCKTYCKLIRDPLHVLKVSLDKLLKEGKSVGDLAITQ